MRRTFHFLSLLLLTVNCSLLTVSLFSCSESSDDDTEYADWQTRNDAYFESIYDKADAAIKGGDTLTWKIICSYAKSPSTTKKTDHIVVQVLAKGTGSVCPVSSDSVQVHYRGTLMPSASYTGGYQFDSTWSDGYNLNTMTPYTGKASAFVDGFTTALLNMHVGDRWKVYIPYSLGYDSTDKTSSGIPAYSTLIFDMTLAKIKN